MQTCDTHAIIHPSHADTAPERNMPYTPCDHRVVSGDARCGRRRYPPSSPYTLWGNAVPYATDMGISMLVPECGVPPAPTPLAPIQTNMFHLVHFIFSSTVSHWLLSLNYNVYLASQHSFSTCRTHHCSSSLIHSTDLPTVIPHATGTSYFRGLSRRELCPLPSAFCLSVSSVFLPPVSWVRFGPIDVVCVLSWNRR